jgi:hypothetical protein
MKGMDSGNNNITHGLLAHFYIAADSGQGDGIIPARQNLGILVLPF